MSAAKKLTDFLPKAEPKSKTSLAQAQVSQDLHKAVREQMDHDKEAGIAIDWQVLITAACREYLSLRGAKKIP